MKRITDEELRQIQLSLLERIAGFCREHDIPCYLFAGTLIGAVRHQGYIPWDDDIDVCMRRKDYERFFRIFNEETAGESVRAVCFENDPAYYQALGKVIDTRTEMKERISISYPIGVYVDVYPLDDLPGDPKKIRALERRLGVYRAALSLKLMVPDKNRGFVKNAVLAVSHVLLSLVSVSALVRKVTALAKTYNGIADAVYLGDLVSDPSCVRAITSASDYAGACQVTFEGRSYDAPIGYDNVLRCCYGDYMKLPPPEKQVAHHAFDAFWKAEAMPGGTAE